MERLNYFASWVFVLFCCVCAFGQKREVAVTIDDLPATLGGLETMTYVTNHLLSSIETNKVPAIGFVNESKVHRRGEMDTRVALWLRRCLPNDLRLSALTCAAAATAPNRRAIPNIWHIQSA